MNSSRRNYIAAPPRARRHRNGLRLGEIAALVCAACVALAGCEPPVPHQAKGRDVVRPHLRFALDVPQGWTVRDLGGDVVLEIVATDGLPRQEQGEGQAAGGAAVPRPRGGPFQKGRSKKDLPENGGSGAARRRSERRTRAVVHVLVIDRENVGLEEWADGAVKDAQALQTDLAVTEREGARLADGREALLVVLENPRAAEPLEQRLLLAVTADRAYALTATAPGSQMAALANELRKCFDTFVVW